MGSILQPGYVRWDGFKYVLDPTVEIVGPLGPAGAAGAAGPAGASGPAGNAVLVYRPGGDGSDGDNVFTSWTGLWVVRSAQPAVPMTIVIDDSFWSGNLSATAVAAPSNGASLPFPNSGPISVDSTAGFPNNGNITVQTSAGLQNITYAGLTGTTFESCTGGTGTLSTGNNVFSPGGACVDEGIWPLNKNTSIIGYKNSPPPDLSQVGFGPVPFPLGVATNSMPVFIVPARAYLQDPSYFQDLTITGWPLGDSYSMDYSGHFPTMDITFRDCWLIEPAIDRQTPANNFINMIHGGTINLYGYTNVDGFDSGNSIFDGQDQNSLNNTFYFNLYDSSIITAFSIFIEDTS